MQVSFDEDRASYQWKADERVHSRATLLNHLRRNPDGVSMAALQDA